MIDYEISDDHLRVLRQASNTSGDEPLPEYLEAKYVELKRVSDRANCPLGVQSLVLLCYALGYGKPTAAESAPPTIIDLLRAGEVKVGDSVEVTWRKKQRIAKVLGVGFGGEVRVQIDGDSEERLVKAELVRVPEKAPEPELAPA